MSKKVIHRKGRMGLTAIMRSKGVFHEQESDPQERPYGASYLR